MIAHEGVVAASVEGRRVHVAATACLFHQRLHETVAELQLEVVASFARAHLRSHILKGHVGEDVADDRLNCGLAMSLVKHLSSGSKG